MGKKWVLWCKKYSIWYLNLFPGKVFPYYASKACLYQLLKSCCVVTVCVCKNDDVIINGKLLPITGFLWRIWGACNVIALWMSCMYPKGSNLPSTQKDLPLIMMPSALHPQSCRTGFQPMCFKNQHLLCFFVFYCSQLYWRKIITTSSYLIHAIVCLVFNPCNCLFGF